jgi:hypothetical protein
MLPVVLGLLTLDGSPPSAQKLADFAQVQSAVGQSIYVSDNEGHERLVKLLAATDRSITLSVAGRQSEMSRDAVLFVDRARDSSADGAVKGALFGLAISVTASLALGDFSGRLALQSMALYGGIGFGLDRAHRNRAPVYRSPAAGVSIRF